MLTNVEAVEELRGLARAKARDHITKTVNPLLELEAMTEGWSVQKRNKRSVRLIRKKDTGTQFEDRVWSLFYRLGFDYLSGEGGGLLKINPKDPNSPTTQIDVVGIDDEVAIAIECKASDGYARRPQFQEELGKHSLIRERFANVISRQLPKDVKRQVALAFFTSNIILSDNDRLRAKEAKIALFDEQDLEYYEDLVSHLGPAAKYQFLADLLPGKSIPGLALRVRAVRTRMGGQYCYTFSVAPSYLLKIAFVSHRAKGKASDVNTYQRMIRKSRLNKIRDYIDADGVFPTNIVVNLDKSPVFHQIEQEAGQGSGRMGWLELRPSYKSAWIIDGQHRLFAYSGHPRADSAHLAVLAFDGLPPSKQAELFIDINAQQKSVKPSLLQELYAELHWNAPEPAARVRAIVSKAIQALDADPESPFHQRILAADEKRDDKRCITLTSLFRALDKVDLYIGQTRRGGILEYGPLWAGDENEATLARTCFILNCWFNQIERAAPDWWKAGAGEGGGLAMNDGVTASIDVLRSVFQHLEASGERLVRLENDDLSQRLDPYASALCHYLGGLSVEERKQFRDLRGVQGVTTRARRFQQAIQHNIPSFDPTGLREFVETERAETNQRAKAIVDRVEVGLQRTVLEELRREFGLDENQWWFQGVPMAVRKAATTRFEEDSGKRGGKEFYVDLIDYRTIVSQNWTIFGDLLGHGKPNASKEKRTSWIHDVNENRKIVSHASSGRSVSLEQLALLEEYDRWLTSQIASTVDRHQEVGDDGET